MPLAATNHDRKERARMDTRLIMLGTGNAMATKCWNTCFVLQGDGGPFLVDAGGGNGIFTQLEKAGIDCGNIHHMFVTHTHTDHVLGTIWVVRKIASLMLKGTYAGDFFIHCHDGVAEAIQTICGLTLPGDHLAFLGPRIHLRVVAAGESLDAAGLGLTFFDIGSTKAKQFGFKAVLPDGQTVVCLGDEPYNAATEPYVAGCDWLLCEAFCLYADRDVFKPYEKHHSTALDAGRLAEDLGVKSLVLYHTEDTDLTGRKARYAAEAKTVFGGNVFVPDDLDVLALSR